ncbi:iron-containing redox enzyme family protein [Mesorhizobium muleiense]|uniref:Iron-containing redox enzyme family protein n=1 Tax=Mesorhizobium temperatum TaxID=241416 RepID=A0A271LDD1_9HYPH|nr:iron-containing redox enzyme family protein [Mesorhizobium temperatum]PAQ05330.1 hypothetical protein CIT26_31595 [Mesorhizobium temperatum]
MTSRTASAHLSAKLDLVHGAFVAYARKLWSGPDVRDVYPVYLRVMHAVVRSAVPLMEAALAEARARDETTPLTAELLAYYAHHMKEEAGHDGWLLEDLAATGHDPAEALDQIPPPAVAAMVGAQYYWIRHFHPVALLGHIAAIEAYHPPSGFALRLAEATGYPPAAFRSISRHEVLDIHHRRDLFELIDRIPLKPHHEKIIAVSGLHTIETGMDVLEFIHATAARERKPAQ